VKKKAQKLDGAAYMSRVSHSCWSPAPLQSSNIMVALRPAYVEILNPVTLDRSDRYYNCKGRTIKISLANKLTTISRLHTIDLKSMQGLWSLEKSCTIVLSLLIQVENMIAVVKGRTQYSPNTQPKPVIWA